MILHKWVWRIIHKNSEMRKKISKGLNLERLASQTADGILPVQNQQEDNLNSIYSHPITLVCMNQPCFTMHTGAKAELKYYSVSVAPLKNLNF